MIPKSLSSTPIGDGYRFSDKIMRQRKRAFSAFSRRGEIPSKTKPFTAMPETRAGHEQDFAVQHLRWATIWLKYGHQLGYA
jgi:hypothetical protein